MKTALRKRLHSLLMLMLLSLSLAGVTYAQTTVQGTVVDDANGEPLPGATILENGTTNGAATDVDGNFTLVVTDQNATLTLSFVGFQSTEIPLNGRTTLNIRMSEDVAMIDEVVVVGYGIQRKSDVTGSVASIRPERLEEVPNVNFVQALQGALPGIQVTTNSAGAEQNSNDILIRGRNSIKASDRPLIVVDGVPYNGSLSEINQQDIATIDILKDASSAAIYGSRGANGVILITTKKGGSSKPTVAYEAYVGVQDIANMPHLMNGEEFASFKCQRLKNGVTCTPEEIPAALSATELANYEAGRWTDWVDLATQQGVQQQHSLSFSGGTGGTRYYISGTALDVKGIARNDEFSRYSFRVNLDQKINDWLDIGTSTQLSYTDRSGMPASFENAFFMNPLANPYEADGETPSLRPWPEDSFSNPNEGLLVRDDDINRRIFTSNFVQVKLPVKGLSYRMNAGIDFANGQSGRFYGMNTISGIESGRRSNTENANRFDWTLENILRYTREFGKHSVDLTALYSAEKNYIRTDVVNAEGLPSDVLTYMPNVATLWTPSYSVTDERMVSQMGRVNYSYDSRYLITLTARRDGASVFAANHKYGVFPSLALGWNIARERFWSVDAINTLKLRVSYGQNGQNAISPYQTLARMREQNYLGGVNGDQTAVGYFPSTLGNPDLMWETTTSFNTGLDFALFNDRIQGSIEVYVSNTSDLLLNRAISPVHGYTSTTQNIGQTRNKGIEFQVSSTNIDNGDFRWSTDFNIAANRNSIVDLYGDRTDDVGNGWFIGQPVDVNFGYKFDGIWQESDTLIIPTSAQPDARPGDVRVLDVNGDTLINADDRVIFGSLEPLYTAGMTNTFRYKGLSLNVFITAVEGITRSNLLRGSNQVWAGVRRNTMYMDYWTPDNPINTYPANSETSNLKSLGFYEDASYIRVRDVTLAYDLPSKFVSRLGVSSLRIYLNGRNLWTLTDWTGLDPELSSQRAIPLERSLIGGVNLRF